MHGARVVALRGNFDQALALVRELVERHPIALVNSVNDFRIEGQKTGAFEVCDELGEPPDVLCIPVGNAGNVTSWWKGFQEYDAAPRAARLPGRGRRAAGARRAGREPGDGGVGDPDRQPGALGGRDERVHRLARRGARGVRRRDPRRLRAARRARGRVLRAGVGGVGGRAAQVRRRGPGGVRAHRPRAEGPADRDEPGQLGGALRAGPRRASSRRCSGEAPPRWSACRRRRPTSARATTCSPRRCRSTSSSRSRRPASSSSSATCPGVPLDRSNLCVRAFEALHPADGLTLPDPLGDPGGRRARLERGGDRRRAVRGRPHVRARRAAVRAGRASSRATPTTWRRRCSAAS